MPEIIAYAKAVCLQTPITASVVSSDGGGPCFVAGIVPTALKAQKIVVAIVVKEATQPPPLSRIIEPMPMLMCHYPYPYHIYSPYLDNHTYVPLENLRELGCCCVIS